jgi:hypothetical protein
VAPCIGSWRTSPGGNSHTQSGRNCGLSGVSERLRAGVRGPGVPATVPMPPGGSTRLQGGRLGRSPSVAWWELASITRASAFPGSSGRCCGHIHAVVVDGQNESPQTLVCDTENPGAYDGSCLFSLAQVSGRSKGRIPLHLMSVAGMPHLVTRARGRGGGDFIDGWRRVKGLMRANECAS